MSENRDMNGSVQMRLDEGARAPVLLPSCRGEANLLHSGNSNLSPLSLEIIGDRNEVTIGHGCNLRGKIHIRGNDSRVVIGDGVTWQGANLIVTEGKSVRIGNTCLFYHGITIRTGDGHSILDRTTGKRLNPAEDVEIGEHVWLGQGVTVLKGAHVAAHCILASGALLSKPIPEEGCIVGGVPAKVLRTGVTWERELIP